jgi:hypothetical protein
MMLKKCPKWGGYKLMKKWQKTTQKWPPINLSKKCSKINFRRGGPGGQNDQNRRPGPGDPKS